MARIVPLAEEDAADKVAQTYSRIKELFGQEAVPSPFLYYGRVPPFLQDFYMNFKKFVWGAGKLDETTRLILALAVAARDNCGFWTEFLTQRLLSLGTSEQQIAEVLAITATNAMYNTFFKFRELSGSDLFAGMGVGLRAHTFAGTSHSEQTVELINIVISDLNACKPCTSGHVDAARQLGLTDEQILEAVQCAATMAAGIAFLKSVGAEV